MSRPVIYHGTPLTPRRALNAILPGRAACVSFWRPEDVEAVEAVCPAVMFRQWRILRMAGSDAKGRGVVHPRGLDPVFRLGRASVACWPVGSDPRCARRALPAQRCSAESAFLRPGAVGTALAHGWAGRASASALRTVRAGLPGLGRDGRGCRRWLRGVVAADGRDCPAARQPMARPSSHAGRAGRPRVPFRQRGRDQRRAERITL